MNAPNGALRPGGAARALRWAVALYAVLLVAAPLAGLVGFGLSDGAGAFWSRVTAPVALSALSLTVWTALLVGALGVVFGTATAWVLVRHRGPWTVPLSAAVDLPLAVPTLVAGVMLAILYGPSSLVGRTFAAWGVEVAFAPAGIVLALMFVTLPFVVRAVAPVLAEIDPAEEEAATLLGAGAWRLLRVVFLPALLPAALSGGVRSVGRALGEFGSVVVIAGNVPFETLTAPVFVFGEIESGAAAAAASVSTVLLALALALHAGARALERATGDRRATR